MNYNRSIEGETICNASIQDVWDVWTTEKGITSFFAPVANIDLMVDGKYEILFNPNGKPGFRGAEGVRILAIQPQKMLAFTWNAPPHLSEVRKQWTHVVIRFEEISTEKTKVTLHHDGWGTGGQWDEAFDYFTDAWLKIVFPRLKYRFDNGPVDWDNPPDLSCCS